MKIKYKIYKTKEVWAAIRNVNYAPRGDKAFEQIPKGFRILLFGKIREDDLYYYSNAESWNSFGPFLSYHRAEDCYMIIIRKISNEN